jgi:hypothetical protein
MGAPCIQLLLLPLTHTHTRISYTTQTRTQGGGGGRGKWELFPDLTFRANFPTWEHQRLELYFFVYRALSTV